MTSSYTWCLPFLQPASSGEARIALIILNQPFSKSLLFRLWHASDWRCCADGGGNRLHDLLSGTDNRPTSYIARLLGWFLQSQRTEADEYLPDLIKGDLDSLRGDVRQYYEARKVPVVQDGDQYSTDLEKCVRSLQEKEQSDGVDVGVCHIHKR